MTGRTQPPDEKRDSLVERLAACATDEAFFDLLARTFDFEDEAAAFSARFLERLRRAQSTREDVGEAAALAGGGEAIWFAYSTAQAFRAAVDLLAPRLVLAPERLWPKARDGAVDWAGTLLQGRLPAYETDSEAGRSALGELVRVRRGCLAGVEFFDLQVTHDHDGGGGRTVSGVLPPSVIPVDPSAECRCAMVSPEGRLTVPGRFRVDRAEGRFIASFPEGVSEEDELRVILLEVMAD